jgi:hypothetical protein
MKGGQHDNQWSGGLSCHRAGCNIFEATIKCSMQMRLVVFNPVQSILIRKDPYVTNVLLE